MRETLPGRRLLPLLGLVVFAVALWALRQELRTNSYLEILQALEGIRPGHLLAAIGLTALNFFILSGYDLLAIRSVGSNLPYRRVAMASSLGYAFSNALGFSFLTGIPVRFRLYTSWGLSAGDVTRVVAHYTFTFWLGLATLGGMVFLWEPGLGEHVLHGHIGLSRMLGGLLLTPAVAYLAWSFLARGPASFRSFEFPMPGPRQALFQLFLGAADWTAAGLVLFLLLPGEHGLSPLVFLGAFILAQIAGLVSTIPGGLGVFEAAILSLLPDALPNPAVLAALLAYRVIYFLGPLVLAVLALGLYEAFLRKGALAEAGVAVREGLTSVVPIILSLSIFGAGASLLLTGAIPLSPADLAWFESLLPLSFLEFSHFLGSIVGAALLILAWGVQRRLDGAYHITVVLLGLGALAAAASGAGLLHAGSLLLLLLVLWAARGEFFRKASLTSEPFTTAWAAALAAVLLATVWLGLFTFKEVSYSSELWWRFALSGHAPRFLRASVGALGVVLIFALQRLLRPARPDLQLPVGVIPNEVPPLAVACPRTIAQMALTGDKQFLLSEGKNAFLMYGREGRSWIALGDPVGPQSEHPELVWQFRNLVHRNDGWPVFFQVTPACLPLYLDAGLTLLKTGEAGLVPLPSFSLEGSHRSGLRQTVRRVERDGGSFEVVPREGVEALLPELRRVSDTWLAEKSAREKRFSLGSFSEDYLRLFPVAVVRAGERLVAFANITASGSKEELAPDLMRYTAEAPDSTMEYLFIQLMLWGAHEGFQGLNLGVAPLSGLETGPLASPWNRMGTNVFRHGEHFYNFQGLRAYKEKFHPVWEPRYLASPGGLTLPWILMNLASLISGGLVGTIKK